MHHRTGVRTATFGEGLSLADKRGDGISAKELGCAKTTRTQTCMLGAGAARGQEEELASFLSLNHYKVGNTISATITRSASRVRIILDP